MDSPLARKSDKVGAAVGWDANTYLLALLTEVVDVNNVILLHAYGDGKAKVRDPLHITRPGEEKDVKDEPVMTTGNEMEAAMRDMGAHVKRKKKDK